MDKEQLLKRADELLKFALDGLEAGKEFAMEQAPLVVQEVVKWGIIEHTLWIVIGLGVTFTMVVLLRKSLKFMPVEEGPLFLLPTIGLVVSVIIVCVNMFVVAKAYFAPRLYLLEQLRSLLH